MSKRYTESDKFKDKWYRQLSPKHKCLWEYMLACCNLAGIIELDLELFSFSIGAEIEIEDFKEFEKRILFIKDDLIFIKNFVLYQQGIKSLDELNPKNKVHNSILAILNKYNLLSPFQAPSKPQARGYSNSNSNSNSNSENFSENPITSTPLPPKREDPYTSPVINDFIRIYKEIYGQSPGLLTPQREKILELNRELPDFLISLPEVLKRLKKLYFKKAQYKPDIVWLLTESNFLKVKSGNYNYAEEESEIENIEIIKEAERELANEQK